MPAVDVQLPATGDRFGDWEVEAIATLHEPHAWRVRNTVDSRTAILRAMKKTTTTEARFRREVDALRGLDHPAIPRYLAHGTDATRDLLWLITTTIEGDRLSDVLGAGPLPWRDACEVFHALAAALAQAHAHGLVHRAVSPAHIEIGPGNLVHLGGWDLAMDATELGGAADAPLGDLAYVAPEVIADPHHHAARADLYALGCSLYEALTGKSAFPAASFADRPTDAAIRMLEWKTRAKALDPGEDQPLWLVNLVRKATDPVSEKRLPDMDAFVGWLEAAHAQWTREPPPPSPQVQLAPLNVPRPSIDVPSHEAIRVAVEAALQGAQVVAQPAPPPRLALYFGASVLGSVTGLALSSVAILFAMSLR